MIKPPATSDRDFVEAFVTHERQERIHTGKVACALVVFLLPVGVVLDYFVYPGEVGFFLALRLVCSALAGVLWFLHTTRFGYNNYRFLGIPIAWLPAFFIAWMIFSTPDSVSSPYYAGLNLILLAVSVVVRWNATESLIAVGGVLLMYLAACLLKDTHGQGRMIVNNFYFLSLTGVIVVVGYHFFTRLRLQEFTLRYQLDKSKGELEESNRKLVELDRLKSRFFANISHELRTPLTLLLSPLESLMQRADNSFDTGTREVFDTMHANAMRLLKLINDLLDLIRLESGRMDIKNDSVHVADFLKGLASAVKQVAVDKHITFETHVGVELDVILTDRDKVEKIVLNLLFNALKFTPADGRVELRAEKQGDNFVLIVTDTGVGISEKNLPFIFDRFWQADNSSRRKFQGVGIGLALVKELVEMMRGMVTVKSEEGKGTTFTVKLPFQKAGAQPKPEITEPAATKDGTVSSDE
ncbi:MAG TPA: HAMP domain-containing sensor histidine kinase [Verrucomicrobiae bacterium]|nr:HAMP domain-containing sensor histidine kinase [Verrucomicrobiae bacterium]